MNKKNNTLALFFITIVTIVIWLWAAGQTKHDDSVSTTLRFRPPEGSTITIMPDSASITLSLSGPLRAVERAKRVCEEDALDLILGLPDGEHTLQNLTTMLNALDSIRDTDAEVTSTNPATFTLHVQTMELVEAAVEWILTGATVSGDVTVDPATVMLQIPKEIRDGLPEAITVQAVISDAALEQLQPNVIHTLDAAIRLPSPLAVPDVTIDPSHVKVTFKIQSKTQKTLREQVRILIAGPAEDHAKYRITLQSTIVPNVTIEADTEIISGIESGDVTVFAIVRLASRDLEQEISEKKITTFLAITADGNGHELVATVEDPALLDIELVIEPITTEEDSQ